MNNFIAHRATHGQENIACSAFAERDQIRHIHIMQLSNIRQMRNLSLVQLAEMIGMDASTVQRAEKMDKTAKLRTYTLCADALGITLADIFSDDRTAKELALLRAFRRIPADRHDLLLGLLEQAATAPPPAEQ